MPAYFDITKIGEEAGRGWAQSRRSEDGNYSAGRWFTELALESVAALPAKCGDILHPFENHRFR